MSGRRRRSAAGRQTGDSERRRPSRTGALRKSRQEKRTRTTLAVVVMAVLCVPLALWIYPRITSHNELSRIGLIAIERLDARGSEILNVGRSQELRDGNFHLSITCEVFNGTTQPLDGVTVTLRALDDRGEVVVERKAEPAGFRLDSRAARKVAVDLELAPAMAERVTALQLQSVAKPG